MEDQLKILILGANHETIPLVQEAKKLGLYTIVTDFNHSAPAKNYADEAWNIDGTDIEKLYHKRITHTINAITIGVADQLLKPYNQLCQKLRLPSFLCVKSLFYLNNKINFNNLCGIFGLQTIQNISLDDIKPDKNGQLNEPLIVKPIYSSSSKGISQCSTIDDVLSAITYSKSVSKNEDYLIQPLLSCRNLLLTFTVYDGNIINFQVAERYTDRIKKVGAPICLGTVYPSSLENTVKRKYEEKFNAVFRYLDFSEGLFTVECFWRNLELIFSDPGARLQGEGVDAIVHKKDNINQRRLLLDIALGKYFDQNQKGITGIKNKFCCHWILLEPGQISYIKGMEKLKNLGSIFEIRQRLFCGDQVKEDFIGTEKQVFARIYYYSQSLSGLQKINKFINNNLFVENEGHTNLVQNQLDLQG